MNNQKKQDVPKIAVLGAGNIGAATVEKLVDSLCQTESPAEIVFLCNRESKDGLKKANEKINGVVEAVGDKDYYKMGGIDLVCSNDPESIRGADVVLMTAGVRAGLINSKKRQESFKYILDIVAELGLAVKYYAPKAFVAIVTNPVDKVTWFVKEVLKENNPDFDDSKIVGFGGDIDAIRFNEKLKSALRLELGDKVDNKFGVSSAAIGLHSKEHLLVPDRSIMIQSNTVPGPMSLSEFMKSKESENINKEELNQTIKSLKETVYKEVCEAGFKRVEIQGGTGSVKGPANGLAKMALAYLGLLKNAKDTTFYASTIVKPSESGVWGIKKEACLTLPIKISGEGREIQENLWKVLSDSDKENLKAAADYFESYIRTRGMVGGKPVEKYRVILDFALDDYKEKYETQVKDNPFPFPHRIQDMKKIEEKRIDSQPKEKDIPPNGHNTNWSSANSPKETLSQVHATSSAICGSSDKAPSHVEKVQQQLEHNDVKRTFTGY